MRLISDADLEAFYKANEALFRTVRRFWQIQGQPQKKIMIGRWNGYHGSTLGSTALGGAVPNELPGDAAP